MAVRVRTLEPDVLLLVVALDHGHAVGVEAGQQGANAVRGGGPEAEVQELRRRSDLRCLMQGNVEGRRSP